MDARNSITINPQSVWNYYRKEDNGESAKCNQCDKILKRKGGSTKGLHVHLASCHDIHLLKRRFTPKQSFSCVASSSNVMDNNNLVSCDDEPIINNNKKRTDYYFKGKDDTSVAAILARMTAKDGIPFRIFSTSEDLRAALHAKGNEKIPASENTIRNIVIGYSEKIQFQLKQLLLGRKRVGQKFSLTFDEWTSNRNRRYLNINIHARGELFWSLGLVRIHKSMNAQACVNLVEERLAKYEIDLNSDIVCITTDGASVMTKVGKLVRSEQQLCFAHGIQLGVLDILYKKTVSKPHAAELKFDEPVDADEIEPVELDSKGSDDESEEDDDEGTGLEIMSDTFENSVQDLSNNFISHIRKVRKVVITFKRSPTKNEDILQKYVKLEEGKQGKETSLLLDSKTRWSSLHTMLKRFLTLKDPVRKALIDLKSKMSFSEKEFNLISEIVESLEPVKLAVEVLCRRDSTLLTADATMEFMLNNLHHQNSDLSMQLYESLKRRIEQRRTKLSGVLKYLNNPNCNVEDESEAEVGNYSEELFLMPSVSLIRKTVIELVNRLGAMSTVAAASETRIQSESSPGCQEINQARENLDETYKQRPLTLQQQMEAAIEKSVKPADERSISTGISILTTIKREMALFEGGGSRPKYLQRAYEYLISIPPTSVESERAFSASGNFCTKIRSRLGDNSLDALCFLRSYFRN